MIEAPPGYGAEARNVASRTPRHDGWAGARPHMALTSAVVAIAPRPVLLITAGTVADEGPAAANFQAAAPTSVEVWTVEAASHISGMASAPAEWEARVIGLLDRAIAN